MLCITATSSNPPGFTVSAKIISVCVIDFIGRKGGFVVGVDNGCVPSVVSMDWVKGKFTGNHGFYH
jgi:hypothetical protein